MSYEMNLANTALNEAYDKRVETMGASDLLEIAIAPQEAAEGKFVKDFVEAVRNKCPRCAIHKQLNYYDPNTILRSLKGDPTQIPQSQYRETLRKLKSPAKWNYKVVTPQGWWFIISPDPGVVEIKTKPSTAYQLEKQISTMRKLIFEVADELHLTGKGETAHLNVGNLSAFKNNPQKFARFYADATNHFELWTGIMGYDPISAADISQLHVSAQIKLANFLMKLQKGAPGSPLWTHATDAAKEINEIVGADLDLFQILPGLRELSTQRKRKEQSVNVTRMYQTFNQSPQAPDEQRVELRAIRQPDSPEEAVLFAKLIQARIRYLDTLPDPVSMHIRFSKTRLSVPELLGRFKLFVEETGLQWDDFKIVIPKHLRNREIDPLAADRLDPNNPSHQKIVINYLSEAGNNPVIRERIKKFLRHSTLQNSKFQQTISGKLKKIYAVSDPNLAAGIEALWKDLGFNDLVYGPIEAGSAKIRSQCLETRINKMFKHAKRIKI